MISFTCDSFLDHEINIIPKQALIIFGHIIAISNLHKTIDDCLLKTCGINFSLLQSAGFYQVLLNSKKDLFVRII